MSGGLSVKPKLVHPNGEDLKPCGCPASGCKHGCNWATKPKAIHSGADPMNGMFIDWAERVMSMDDEMEYDRTTLVARTRALGNREDGHIDGALEHICDSVVGTHFRIKPNVNGKALGWTPEQVEEMNQKIACQTEGDYYGASKLMDTRGRRNMTVMAGTVLMTTATSGDSFTKASQLSTRDRPFSLSFDLIDPMRVFNPASKKSDAYCYWGVEKDKKTGRAKAYYLHNSLPHARKKRQRQITRPEDYTRYPARKPWGREIIIHVFDGKRDPEATRGKPWITSIISDAKGISQLKKNTLKSSVVQSLIAAVITSAYPDAGDALGAGNPDQSVANQYMQEAAEWLDRTGLVWGDTKIPRLYPGEKLDLKAPHQPFQSFDAFEQTFHATMARSLGISMEEYTGRYNKTSYSGARMGLLASWRRYLSIRENIVAEWANRVHAVYLEEQLLIGRIEYPRGIREQLTTARLRANYFIQNKDALVRANWFGPGREEVDPVKGAMAAKIRQEIGHRLDSDAVETETGRPWDEHIEMQIAEEKKKLELAKIRAEIAALEGGAGAPVTDTTARFDEAKTKCDAYGVAVRSGKVTPQPEDEVQAREDLDLPPMNSDVEELWVKQGNARSPITLKSAEESEDLIDGLDNDDDESSDTTEATPAQNTENSDDSNTDSITDIMRETISDSFKTHPDDLVNE